LFKLTVVGKVEIRFSKERLVKKSDIRLEKSLSSKGGKWEV